MIVARTATQLRGGLTERRRIGFVPTMGALHQGHRSLLRAARTRCDTVVISIFVNPLQFGPGEDLATYPRDEEGDLETARADGVDVAFVPTVGEIYPDGHEVTVDVGRLGTILEGAFRPGHFDGVATVVAKLFNLVGPERAFFGEKDAQQVAVIRKLVTDLAFPVEIEVCPTVREPDGLAMSSRNRRLTDEDRARAPVLWGALQAGRSVLESGGDPQTARSEMLRILHGQPGTEVDYADVVDPATFGAELTEDVLLVVAARVGGTRLIDNLAVRRRLRT